MVAQGLLLVFTEPGSQIPEEEFHDWYDHEHIPPRIALPEITHTSRYKATDGTQPNWAALYELSDLNVMSDERYTSLLTTKRSAREADLMKKIGELDRRVYALLSDTGTSEAGGIAEAITFHVNEMRKQDFRHWYEKEYAPILTRVPGWLRLRLYRLVESGRFGTMELKGKAVPEYLTLVEWENASTFESAAAAMKEGNLAEQIGSRRWTLYKEF